MPWETYRMTSHTHTQQKKKRATILHMPFAKEQEERDQTVCVDDSSSYLRKSATTYRVALLRRSLDLSNDRRI